MAGTDTINQIVSEKLDDNNFHAWKFRMTNFLMGKGYWEYIDGEHEEALLIPEENPAPAQAKALKDWNQGARKVLLWLSISHDWPRSGCCFFEGSMGQSNEIVLQKTQEPRRFN